MDTYKIFDIATSEEFDSLALEIFRMQYRNNKVYREFCGHLGRTVNQINRVQDIPFLPIQFFKTKTVISGTETPTTTFISSGTTGSNTSKHYVTDLKIYESSYLKAFEHFYGNIAKYCVLALLPSYLERKGSSLIYMVDDLIKKSNHPDSGFYLHDLSKLKEKLVHLDTNGVPVLLIGVTFALLDMSEKQQLKLKHAIVMETGGMKGKRLEMVREKLHQDLIKGFGVPSIHSEYGMTELLSQAYSLGNGIFNAPAWMKICIRDTEDPLSLLPYGKTGGVNIIDLANINSCCFIATQDLGKIYDDGSFEILGRFDNSDIRGCNLMVI